MFTYNACAPIHSRVCQLIDHVKFKVVALEVFIHEDEWDENKIKVPSAFVAIITGPGNDT